MSRRQRPAALRKVVFDREGGTETVWAETVGDDRYRLRNTPFYVYGVSENDIVIAKPIPDSSVLAFARVSLRGGHSTYRLFLLHPDEERAFRKYRESLERTGCRYERATRSSLAIDVPPSADIYSVYDLLAEGEKAGVWEFEEGHCGHPLKQPQEQAQPLTDPPPNA
jgi:hypothetical protein